MYTADYRGYIIHITQRTIHESNKDTLTHTIRSIYIGVVLVNNTPIYLDYMKPSNNGYIRTEWRDLSDAISNVKWFVKNQLLNDTKSNKCCLS